MSLIQICKTTTKMRAQHLMMMALVQMTALVQMMMTPPPPQTALMPPMAQTLPMVPTHLMVQTAKRKTQKLDTMRLPDAA